MFPGESAFARLKKAYGEKYLYAGLGTKIEQRECQHQAGKRRPTPVRTLNKVHSGRQRANANSNLSGRP
jgi:predicted GIY-YIG superfamily endonuclease